MTSPGDSQQQFSDGWSSALQIDAIRNENL